MKASHTLTILTLLVASCSSPPGSMRLCRIGQTVKAHPTFSTEFAVSPTFASRP